MDRSLLTPAQQIAEVATVFQQTRTGRRPKSVVAVLSEDVLVVSLDGALSPAEQALSETPEGATGVQEYHRQLFANSTDEMRQEINQITGRQVREAAVEIETATGTVVHAFTTGAIVQVFLLTPDVEPDTDSDRDSIHRAEDDGLHVPPEATFSQDDSNPYR